MKLLEAEPTVVAPGPPRPEGEAAPPAEPPARACARCSAPMAVTQDWCLECGTAAPGRLGERPGWRAASTVVGLTLLLVLGAVAASYAALTGDAAQVASRPAGPPAAPAQQAPPAVPAAPAPPAEAPPVTGGEPRVDVPDRDEPKAPPAVEVDPPATSPSTDAPVTGGGAQDDGAASSGPARLALDADAGSIYDPYGKAVDSNAPARALDRDPGTSWTASAAEDAETMGFGYVVDLDDAAEVDEVVLQTRTPGFRVEVYGATSRALPPDVLDDRWLHLRDRSDVDSAVGGAPKDGNRNGDGEERIVLGERAAGKRLRHVLLWFTLVPENGPTIKLTEVELRG